MTAPASLKAELISRIEEMTKEEVERLLDFVNMHSEDDELTPEEEDAVLAAMEEMEREGGIPQAELERKYGYRA